MNGKFRQAKYNEYIGSLIGIQPAFGEMEDHYLVSFAKPAQEHKEADEAYAARIDKFQNDFPKYRGGPCHNLLLPASQVEVLDE